MISRPRSTFYVKRGYRITRNLKKQCDINFFLHNNHFRHQLQPKHLLTTQSRTMTTTTPPKNAWESSPAAYDFRSDTFTTPTLSMLSSLTTCSLGDEVFGESLNTTLLENRLSKLFKKPASLFVLSGTMGNQLCLRAHLNRPPHSVLCDVRAHINVSEAGGLASLSQAMIQPVTPSNGKWITLQDIKKVVVLSDNVHYAPTRVISLENTIYGVIMPLDEIRRISAFAKENNLLVHLDGARLWNACGVPGAPELHEYAAEVDSLSVCFSKSLGAPVGSFILGTEELVAHARHMRKAVGGGIRQSSVLTAMAEVALDEVYFAGRLREADRYAKRLEAKWKALGGEVAFPVDTNMVWLDLDKRGVEKSLWRSTASEEGVKVLDGRLVCHFQNTIEAIERLERVMEVVCSEADKKRAN